MISTTQVDVERELASVCGVLNASYARLVAITAGVLDDESWAIAGVRSPEHWLTMRSGLSPFHARQVVMVARRHSELPSVMAEFADGQLSLDQVAVIARYAPAHVEASVAEMAVHASVPQLGRALSRYSFDPPAPNGYAKQSTVFPAATADTKTSSNAANDSTTDDSAPGDSTANGAQATISRPGDSQSGDSTPGCAEATSSQTRPWGCPSGPAGPETGPVETWNGFALTQDRASAPAELSMSHDQWGRFTLRFNAPADVGALIEAALTEAKDALFAALPTSAQHREVTWADALIEIMGRSLADVTSINRRDTFRTYIHLDTEGAWLAGQPRLPAHLAAKLTCDGILQPVWHTQGAPVNVGRAQRIVPARTRRLVEDRDRGCRYPGCAATRRVECHHLIHWADGGPTDTYNLAALCPYHHDAHHNREFTIIGNADTPNGLTFTTRHGFPIHPGPTFTTPTNPPRQPPTPRQPPHAAPPPDSTQPPHATRPPHSEAPPESAPSPAAPGAPDPPRPPDAASSQEPSPPDSPSHAKPYRGPSGDTISLRWVTFHEPPRPVTI